MSCIRAAWPRSHLAERSGAIAVGVGVSKCGVGYVNCPTDLKIFGTDLVYRSKDRYFFRQKDVFDTEVTMQVSVFCLTFC